MPGFADPALGSHLLTRVVALLASAAVIALPFVTARDRPVRFAVGGGLAYAVCCLVCWLGARLLTGTLPSGMAATPLSTALLVSGALVVLGLQAALPLYAYRRYGVVTPLVGLALLTNLVVFTFLMVRGETDPLGLYTLVFGPLLVAGLALLTGLELGGRRLLGRPG